MKFNYLLDRSVNQISQTRAKGLGQTVWQFSTRFCIIIEVSLVEVKPMLDCYHVADYFLALTNEDEGDLISNLKLQKLMYYAQGLHLAVHDTPIFPERIEAWLHGPVVPDLYYANKDFGSGPLPKPERIDFSKYDDATRSILDEVYSVFGQFAAWKLANMTHEEEPWREAAQNSGEISHESLKTFFRTLMTHG